MKYSMSIITTFLNQKDAKRNIAYLLRFACFLFGMIALYSVLFHYLMALEGQEHSWLTGLYWTLTVMTTLGFGDITFASDLGRFFSILVMLSGVIFLLVMLPFMFIQYFYAPWLKAQKDHAAKKPLPIDIRNHVIIVGVSPTSLNLADDLIKHNFDCIFVCEEINMALDLIDKSYKCILGDHDLATTYEHAYADTASMLITLDNDMRNTSVVFTVREVSKAVPITSKVESIDSVDILQLAGATHVCQFYKILGESLARRVVSRNSYAGEIGNYKDLILVEAPSMRTHLVGKTLRQADLRKATGVNVIGIWDRGIFTLAQPESTITKSGVLVMAGTAKQIQAFNNYIDAHKNAISDITNGTILILGGGRVGIAAAHALEERGLPYCIVDKSRIYSKDINQMQGDAADLSVLEKAGLNDATSILITTHDDDTNIYLTIYCRRLRPNVQIISRATLNRNISILHNAGADLVMSHVSIMTNTILNLLQPAKNIMLHEGLSLSRIPVSKDLIGKSILSSGIRETSNTSIIAIETEKEELLVNPDPKREFLPTDSLLVVTNTL